MIRHPPGCEARFTVRVLATLGMLAVIGCATSTSRVVDGTPPVRRVAAEWEPAIGVLVRWPAYLPHRLLLALAEDTTLYVLVENDDVEQQARDWFDRWDVPRDRVRFLHIPGSDDAQWTRDYGPHPLFTEDGALVLVDARYDKSTPDSGLACDAPLKTPWNGGWGDRFLDYDVMHEDPAPTAIAEALGLDAFEVPIVLTGGNVMTDGRGRALSTCILTNENRSNGIADDVFFRLAARDLGLDDYDVIPNFELDGIQHIDCLLKMLDDHRLLVARPPADHPLRARIDDIVRNHLQDLRTRRGEPFEIIRIDTARAHGDELAAYTNSLVLNATVYVPLFGIPQDQIALEQWQMAMPGHTVKGFEYRLDDEPVVPDRARRMYPNDNGWRGFDALHCRTRAVWDPNMLHLSVDAAHRAKTGEDTHDLVVTIIPYSGAPLLRRDLVVCWRLEGDDRWQRVALRRRDDGQFLASIEAPPDAIIEYTIHARDTSGRRASLPLTAPAAYRTSRPADHTSSITGVRH